MCLKLLGCVSPSEWDDGAAGFSEFQTQFHRPGQILRRSVAVLSFWVRPGCWFAKLSPFTHGRHEGQWRAASFRTARRVLRIFKTNDLHFKYF